MQRRKTNSYKINGNITIIYITNRKKETFECLIDTKNLNKVIDLSWHIRYDPNTNGYYVAHKEYLKDENGKRKSHTIEIHSLLMGSKIGKYFTDHINNNGLDNREENLRICSNKQNTSHRKSRNKNNKTGYRNVCFFNDWYIIQLQINGKNKVVGRTKNLEDAGKIAEEMRLKYYGEFAGKN